MSTTKASQPVEEKHKELKSVLTEGQTKEDVCIIYNKWANKSAGNYDQDMVAHTYRGPFVVAKAVRDNCPDKEIHILDVACGTGLVGEHLKSFGFKNVDGMDPSVGMLDEAKAKNVYSKYFCSEIGPGSSSNIPDNTYDVITIAGGFGPGHIPCEAVDEMIRIVKPGGYIFNVTRCNHLETFSEYKDKWEPYIAKKETEKKWKEISRTIFSNYFLDFKGILYIHEVLGHE